MYRCSNSNRVAAALSATNSSTTSLARSGSASNFPIRLQVPRKHHPPRRIPQQHSSPLAFRSVAVPLVPPPALFLLHHDLVERLERYVVRRWPPLPHLLHEHAKRLFSGYATWIVRFTTAIGAAASGYMFLLLPVFFLNEFFERVQRLVPQICKVIAQHRNSLWIQLVNPPRAGLPVAHQPRLFQHPQMLRHRGPRNWQSRRQLVHRLRVLRQRMKDRQLGRIPQRSKSVFYVSIHLR